MAEKRALYVSQEIYPYTPDSEASRIGRDIPVGLQGEKYEVRTFMPRYGSVNERRNQLHEVIRLSGMNISIDDNDHPLILKVASMQPSRIQVYFIDNDDYFQKEDSDIDVVGSNREDNDERAIFFARGTTETIKKLKWESGVIHMAGWMAALVPLYLRQMFNENHSFKKTKVVYEVTPETLQAPLSPRILEKMRADKISARTLKEFKEMTPDTNMLHKLGIAVADGVVFRMAEPDPDLVAFAEAKGIPYTIIQGDDIKAENYSKFYDTL